MSRELTVQVIKMKQSLYSKLAAIEKKKEDIANHYFSSNIETEDDYQKKFRDAEKEESEEKVALHRAQLFSLRHAKGTKPYCIFCFVEHDDLSSMVEISPRILGTSLFRCEKCNQELKIDAPPVTHP